MSFKSVLLTAVAAVTLAVPAFAGSIMIEGAYARSSGASAKSGAAFMTIMNHGSDDDRLISASSDIARKIETHTHIEAANGVMQMREVEGGFVIPAGESHALARGGDHLMFMGLNGPMVQDQVVTVTLTFEKAGEMVVEIPVDLKRKPMMKMDHSKMKMKKKASE